MCLLQQASIAGHGTLRPCTYLLHVDNGVGGRLLYLEDVEATSNGTLLVLHLCQLALHVIDVPHSLGEQSQHMREGGQREGGEGGEGGREGRREGQRER